MRASGLRQGLDCICKLVEREELLRRQLAKAKVKFDRRIDCAGKIAAEKLGHGDQKRMCRRSAMPP